MNGEAVEMKVERQGDKLLASQVFKNERGGDEAKAQYQLSLKVCNPGC